MNILKMLLEFLYIYRQQSSSLVHGQLIPIYMVGRSHFYMPTPASSTSDEQEVSFKTILAIASYLAIASL